MREKILQILKEMPDESFDWFVLACQERAMMQGGHTQIWPDGIGGFTSQSRASITAIREAAGQYIKEKMK